MLVGEEVTPFYSVNTAKKIKSYSWVEKKRDKEKSKHAQRAISYTTIKLHVKTC